jgi:hypothetical protein
MDGLYRGDWIVRSSSIQTFSSAVLGQLSQGGAQLLAEEGMKI